MATHSINLSAQDLRTIFSKNGGSVATPARASYQLNDLQDTVDVFTQFEIAAAILNHPAF